MTIVKQDDFSVQLLELDKIVDICKKLMAMPHYKKLGEEGIHAIIARARSLDIHPFEALNGGFHCINGKVGMSTEMMAALVRKRGHSVTMIESSNTFCSLKGKRVDNGDEWICTFSEKDAVAAGLWNSATWKKYPKVMLYNRCMSMLFRQLFPDLSLGAGYVQDELQEITKTGDYSNAIEVDSDVYPSEEEVIELEKILTKCSEAYVVKIKTGLNGRGWESFGQLPLTLFNNLKTEAIRKMEEEAKKSEVKEEGVEE